MAFGAIRAGQAFVEILARNNIQRGLNAARAQLRTFAGTTARLGSAFLASGVGLGAALVKPIMAASSAEQVRSRFKMVFGDQADEAQAFVDSIVDRLKRGEKDVQDAMASFQAQLRGRGFESDFARKLSEELTQLSIDFASFSDVADEEALQRFLSALSGETESLDRYGIDLHEAAMNQELLAMGIGKTVQQATEQEKTLARMSIIRKSMERMGALDNAFLTSDEFANRLKVFTAAWDRFMISLGESLLPAVTPIVDGLTAFSDTMAVIIKQVPAVGPGLLLLAGGLVAMAAALFAIGLTASAVGGLLTALAALPAILPALIIAGAVLGGTILQAGMIGAAAAAWIDLGLAFNTVLAGFNYMWGGILAALQKGDLETAANIAVLGVTLAFATGFRDILKMVVQFVADAAKELLKLVDYVPFAENLGIGSRTAVDVGASAVLSKSNALVDQLTRDLAALVENANTDFGPIPPKVPPAAAEAAAAGALAARRQGQSIGTFSSAEVRQIARALGGSTQEQREEKKVDLLQEIARNTKYSSVPVFT